MFRKHTLGRHDLEIGLSRRPVLWVKRLVKLKQVLWNREQVRKNAVFCFAIGFNGDGRTTFISKKAAHLQHREIIADNRALDNIGHRDVQRHGGGDAVHSHNGLPLPNYYILNSYLIL